MPTTFTVSRSVRIAAPPAEVFPHLADLRRWVEWSPWEVSDPTVVRTYTGRPGQVGSAYAWRADREAGEGSMTVTEVEPGRRIALDVHFERPYPADSTVQLDVDPDADGTASTVTWSIQGGHQRLLKLLGRLLPMEKMVGKEFDQGLARLREVVEA